MASAAACIAHCFGFFRKAVHCMKKEAGPEITQMPTLAQIYGTFLPLLTLEQGVEDPAVPLEQVDDECCCKGPCSPQGLSPLKLGTLCALGKPLVGLGWSWRQQAALRSRGLCCSLGNHTQANSLMNSGSSHKSCWEVQGVPAAPEPLAAVCWRGCCAARVTQPTQGSQGGSLLSSWRGG